MPRLSIWQGGNKGEDYRFIDRSISEWFGISGTAVLVHLYQGTYGQGEDADDKPITELQDFLFGENRDRKYSKEVFETRGIYNVADVDFDLRQFGMFLTHDSLFIEFHLNDVIAQLGRKFLTGDVLELPHLRDDAVLDDGAAINKFYVVEDVNRASTGYSPTWYPHVLRVKCTPMAAAEEYRDILNKQATDPLGYDTGLIADLMSTIGREQNINEEVVDAAKANVTGRNFQTQHFYVVPGDETGKQNPWVFAGDGVPPNGAALVGSGNRFPDDPDEGDYYLRLDYSPHRLFRRVANRWRMQEIDYREATWSAASRLLKSFINNENEWTAEDGTEMREKQGLHVAIKPRADL